jgi:hypothetical protein
MQLCSQLWSASATWIPRWSSGSAASHERYTVLGAATQELVLKLVLTARAETTSVARSSTRQGTMDAWHDALKRA